MNSNRNDKATGNIVTSEGNPVPLKIPHPFPVRQEPSYNGAPQHRQPVSHEQQSGAHGGGGTEKTKNGGVVPSPSHVDHKTLRRGKRSISVSEGQVAAGDRKLHRKRSSYDLRDDFHKCAEPLEHSVLDGNQNNKSEDPEGGRRRSVTMSAAMPSNNGGLRNTEGG